MDVAVDQVDCVERRGRLPRRRPRARPTSPLAEPRRPRRPRPAARSAPQVSLNAQGAGPGFGVHLCDVEVDPETGHVTVLRYTAAQDVGKAIHPAYVEGQIQGGVAQGVGWALNEEYIFDRDGRMENAGFLDYRVPVASDLPMIDTVLVEVRQSAPPVRGQGRRRGADRAAAGGRRQRGARRDRRAHAPTCRSRRRRSAPPSTPGDGGETFLLPHRGRGTPKGWRGLQPARSRPAPPPGLRPYSPRRGERRHLTVPHIVAACSSCRAFTGDVTEFDVDATTVREAIQELDRRFPGFGEHVERRMAVAIDGEIHQDALFAPLTATSEVVLIPKIGGG